METSETNKESLESGYEESQESREDSVEPLYETIRKPEERKETENMDNEQNEIQSNRKISEKDTDVDIKDNLNLNPELEEKKTTSEIYEDIITSHSSPDIQEKEKQLIKVHIEIESLKDNGDITKDNVEQFEKSPEVNENNIDINETNTKVSENININKNENIYTTISEVKKEKQEQKRIVQELMHVAEEIGRTPRIPTPPPRLFINSEQTFVEEEYSYEPEMKTSSSKLVLRTRSLLNLQEDRQNQNQTTYFFRPPAIRNKITTGPDGTFVIDGRKASSELNLTDEGNHQSPDAKRLISGEELRKRKEEIFKPKEKPIPNMNKYNEEINSNNKETTKEKAINNLKKYLKENNIGLKELLTNNNVVIIDTYQNEKTSQDPSEYNHKTVAACKITGATTKTEARASNTLPRTIRAHQPLVQRHYFYRLVKSRPSPPDDELPDPDKVRSTRQMFQNGRSHVVTEVMLPIAAKIKNPTKEARPTPEVRLVQSDRSPRRWTDTGSISSGVSSDMSIMEDNISEKSYTTDDEDMHGDMDQHPISAEVLKKIRACGTTITYYGGRVISHTHGSGNPMTMTIMDEIRQGKETGKGKFRLVKSNSCGSRLELAGTEDYTETSRGRFWEDMYGARTIHEELGRVEEEQGKRENTENIEVKKENIIEYPMQNGLVAKAKMKEILNEEPMKQPSWLALIESRKQKRALEHHRRPCADMEFEEYQVVE